MSKPSRSFPRPLSELLDATLSDVLKAQGFASTEIISRWNDIVGPEIAGHSEPTQDQLAARSRPTRSRNPPLWCCGSRVPRRSKFSTCQRSFSSGSIVSSVGRPSAELPFGKPRSGAGNRRHPQKSMMPRPRGSPTLSPTSRMTICVRRWAGWVRRSREIEPSERLGRRACHCHNCAVQLANTAEFDRRLAQEPPLQITRRKFCQTTATLALATSMLGFASLLSVPRYGVRRKRCRPTN